MCLNTIFIIHVWGNLPACKAFSLIYGKIQTMPSREIQTSYNVANKKKYSNLAC